MLEHELKHGKRLADPNRKKSFLARQKAVEYDVNDKDELIIPEPK